jgi:hypothetical protein
MLDYKMMIGVKSYPYFSIEKMIYRKPFISGNRYKIRYKKKVYNLMGWTRKPTYIVVNKEDL